MRVADLEERVSPLASSQGTKPGAHHANAHQRALLAMPLSPGHRSPIPTPNPTAREPIRPVCERRRVAAWCEGQTRRAGCIIVLEQGTSRSSKGIDSSAGNMSEYMLSAEHRGWSHLINTRRAQQPSASPFHPRPHCSASHSWVITRTGSIQTARGVGLRRIEMGDGRGGTAGCAGGTDERNACE